MKHDWTGKLKALMYAICEHELFQCADGVTKATHSITHRGQRLVVEARYFKAKHRTALTVYSKGKMQTFEYTEGRPVFHMGHSALFTEANMRDLYKKVERLILRHYTEHQAEAILSRALDTYHWSKSL